MKKGKVILCAMVFLIFNVESKLFAQVTSKEITDGFFALYAKDPSKAVAYAFATNKWMLKKPDEVSNVKTKLKGLTDMLGEYHGHEVISENSISPDFKIIKFLVKYDREPIQFTFLFYKPSDKWIVQNFSFDENLDKEIDKAPKMKEAK